jgi:hypothetical protein
MFQMLAERMTQAVSIQDGARVRGCPTKVSRRLHRVIGASEENDS